MPAPAIVKKRLREAASLARSSRALRSFGEVWGSVIRAFPFRQMGLTPVTTLTPIDRITESRHPAIQPSIASRVEVASVAIRVSQPQ